MLRTLFVLAILSSGLIAGLFSRYAALVFYVWFAMFRPVEWLWMDISAYRPSLVVGLLLVVPCLASGIVPAFLHPIGLGMLTFLGCSLFAQLGAVDPSRGWPWVDYSARVIVVALLMPQLATTPRRVLVLVGVLGGSFLFHGAKAGLASLLGGGVRFGLGLSGAFVDNNGYALGTAMALFLFLGVAQGVAWRPLGRAMIVAGPLGGLAVVSLFSRGGLIGLAAGSAVFLALQRRGASLLFTAALVAASLAYLPTPTGYDDRIGLLTGKVSIASDNSASSRLHFWRTAIDMAAARPFGVGLWNYSSAYDQFDASLGAYGRRRSVHSSHLQVLAEVGLVGFAAYVFILGWTVWLLLAVWRRAPYAAGLSPDEQRMCVGVATGALASMAAFAVGGATISVALNDMTWFTCGAAIALERVVARAAETTAPATESDTPWAASST